VFPDFSTPSFLTYNFSYEENDWSSIKSSILNNNFLTQEFIQISYLIHFSIINGRPTLIIWQSCSGKFSKFQATISLKSDFQFWTIPLSKCIDVEMLLKTFDHSCNYEKSISGRKLVLKIQNSFLIFLIDHMNLPSYNKYGTQNAVSIFRQIIEKRRF
jgi:hypothetical protein